MSTVTDRLGRDAVAEKGWLGAHKWLIARRISQAFILALFLAGPVAGIWILKGNLSSSRLLDWLPMTDPLLFLQFIFAGHFAIAQDAIIGAGLVVAFYLLVGGRLYCAWVCPVNIITDAAHWLRRRLKLKSSARIGRQTRVWMLAAVLAVALVTGTAAYELINPVLMFHRGLVFGMGLAWTLVLGIFLFDLLVMKHGWCGHLCPMGALYGIIGSASLVRVRADARATCDDCMECYEVCPEPQVIPPALMGARHGKPEAGAAILSGACTNCARCIDICPHDVFNFGWRFSASQAGGRQPQNLETAPDGL
ncbi:Polyferredoxin NapH (periplasmic nitrate reductase) [hydrothermal vent metagenome]|uniref:Polyferredoxin NapH (Periplasmic nitrate reductase) n=1 Tax=hydrothermal vent metagenome TaxID=652676 RepID=A0A3B0TMA0_9ZZZZ